MIRGMVLTTLVLTATGLVLSFEETADPAPAMAKAADAFLAALDPAERAKAALPFNSAERLDWHFVPRDRQGVPLKQMSADERKAALALLRSGLSARGFTTVDTILHLEEVLFALEGAAMRDPGLYYFTVFGKPSDQGAWGWRYEGHHVSLNWTILNGKVVGSSPQFLGANPADVRDGPQKGTRALAAEEDLGRAFVKSMTPEQRSAAVVSAEAPRDILTGASREAAIQEDKGIAYARLSQEQQGLLLSLIQEYASTQALAVAQARLARVKAELPNVKFAWMGGLEKGQGHYYRIQGSTFLIEYDNTQNGANHIHSVWRDFKGDWGRDLLAEHYLTAPHHAVARRADNRP
ncbi:MAG TPA: DUF3500 domain-containing protein [Vicinamibacteria bacterium]|nr:DUF3500 domain-containing protein [Vicinamibacteria bacterium]